jgi:hypothetical protein
MTYSIHGVNTEPTFTLSLLVITKQKKKKQRPHKVALI